MAIILEFRRTEEAVSRRDKPVDGLLGEIIIFPGVRIERRTPADAPRPTGSATRRRTARTRKKSRA